MSYLCFHEHHRLTFLPARPLPPTEAIAGLVQAASATGLPTVLVTPSAAAASTKNAVGRLALPKLGGGEAGAVTLSGFSAQQPVALEMTARCLLGVKDQGVALGSFTPPANDTPVRLWTVGSDLVGVWDARVCRTLIAYIHTPAGKRGVRAHHHPHGDGAGHVLHPRHAERPLLVLPARRGERLSRGIF